MLVCTPSIEALAMPRYWIGVASREHVQLGVAGGFCQLCHGKSGPLKRMSQGDWIVYYSPTQRFGEAAPCQRFTAIGQVSGALVYPFEMAPGFVPWRRDVHFAAAAEIPIRPLIDRLGFIMDKRCAPRGLCVAAKTSHCLHRHIGRWPACAGLRH